MDRIPEPNNFIEEVVAADLASGKTKEVVTRFPPEPNGYLHIGHAKAIYIDFQTAEKYGGRCNMRFDDTNPVKEDVEYVQSILYDIGWLGFQWDGEVRWASDYFDRLYQCAEQLVERGKAFVCDLDAEQLREYRGTLTEPGRESPFRDRSVEENLRLFREMRDGKYADGEKTLRAKIDMASPNINMRDPVVYRVLHAAHHRIGDKWCIYPMYDYAHPLSDAIEGITHSTCSLEFEDHRPLYDWFLQALDWPDPPRQFEFARLNVQGVMMSKRYLRRLVEENIVDGWDDPRMPTLSGMRRRGYTPASILDFCGRIGVAKANNVVEPALLEHCLRDDLKPKCHRRMAVLRPLELEIINFPEGESQTVEVVNNAENPDLGQRRLSFSKRLFIEKDDFAIDPPPKYKRLSPGREVRLMGAYIVKCVDYQLDEAGLVNKVFCEYDPESISGTGGRKVKGVIHWVDAATCADAEIRLYGELMKLGDTGEYDELNEDSLTVTRGKVEASLALAQAGDTFQFIRQGYFCRDSKDEHLCFNLSVGLKDTWGKIQSRSYTNPY